MTNSTPPAARDWRLGATVIVPATDAVSLAAASGGGPGFSRHEDTTAARRQAPKARRGSRTGSFYAMAPCSRGGEQAESADERPYFLAQHLDRRALVGRRLSRVGQALPAGEDRIGGLPHAIDFCHPRRGRRGRLVVLHDVRTTAIHAAGVVGAGVRAHHRSPVGRSGIQTSGRSSGPATSSWNSR